MNEHDLKRIEIDAAMQLRNQDNPPETEVVSNDEVYLLSDGNRLRQICGYVEDEWPCLRPAGRGTLHVGTGRCKTHDYKEAGKKDYIKRLYSIIGKESKLSKQLNYIVDNPVKFTIQDLQNMLGLLLTNFVDMNQNDLSGPNTRQMLEILTEIRKLLESQSKIEQNRVATMAIAAYVDSVLKIVNEHVDRTKFDIIVDKINSTPLPKDIEEIEFVEL